jgi:hypothetical protein
MFELTKLNVCTATDNGLAIAAKPVTKPVLAFARETVLERRHRQVNAFRRIIERGRNPLDSFLIFRVLFLGHCRLFEAAD